jgi:hypothetical protein
MPSRSIGSPKTRRTFELSVVPPMISRMPIIRLLAGSDVSTCSKLILAVGSTTEAWEKSVGID